MIDVFSPACIAWFIWDCLSWSRNGVLMNLFTFSNVNSIPLGWIRSKRTSNLASKPLIWGRVCWIFKPEWTTCIFELKTMWKGKALQNALVLKVKLIGYWGTKPLYKTPILATDFHLALMELLLLSGRPDSPFSCRICSRRSMTRWMSWRV